MSLTTVHRVHSWQMVRLESNFSTTDNATPQATGLAFTPEANKRYWVRAALLVSSTATTASIGVGMGFPTGMPYATGRAQTAQSRDSADPSSRNYGLLTLPPAITVGNAIDVANETYWARFEGSIETGATPSGDMELYLQVEAGQSATVTLHEGSTLMWWDYTEDDEIPATGVQWVVLEADHTSSDEQGVGSGIVPDFAFTPEPDTRYYVEGVCMLTATEPNPGTTNDAGPRIAISWPAASVVDQVCILYGSGLYLGPCIEHCEGELLTTDRTLNFTGISSPSGYSYPAIIRAWFETGPVVSNDFQILLFTEDNSGAPADGAAVIYAGSFLRIYSGHTNQ